MKELSCSCGTTIFVHDVKECVCGELICPSCLHVGGWNHETRQLVLCCDACQTRRDALLEEVHQACEGKNVDYIILSAAVYPLLVDDDFIHDTMYRRVDRMGTNFFQIIEM